MPSAADIAARLALDGAWQVVTMGAVAASPAFAAWDLVRGRGLRPVASRLGLVPESDARPAWIAAASAGELAAGAPLLRALAAECPLALSVGTRHGLAAATRAQLPLAAAPFHPPVDALPCVALALRRLRPRALVLIETEIWPNLVRSAARRKVPVAIANGRLSERSFPGYRRARALVARALRSVDVVAARTDDDARRFVELGARPEAVTVAGNMKFDAALAASREPDLPWAARAGLTDGHWLAFGSTAPGEEDLLLEAFTAARRERPALRLLLAPKRPDRWDEVARLAASRGHAVTRRSSFPPPGPATPVEPGGILLLDSTGELARGYRHARLAFVGGSLVPHGGQNLLEPAAAGVPVLFGPHVENFRDAEEALLASGGGRRVAADGLAGEIMKLVVDESSRNRMAAAAREAVTRHEGATRRTVELLRPLLGNRPA